MKRIFIEGLSSSLTNIKPDADVIHRVRSVLRSQDGSLFELIDGKGLILGAEFNKKNDTFTVLNSRTVKKNENSELCVAVSLIRRERFDLLVEKATELGVDRIIPFVCERSRPYTDESYVKLKERWQRISDQAISQCRRDFRVVIDNIVDFNLMPNLIKNYKESICFDPSGVTIKNKNFKKDTATIFIIGPEGGFTNTELLTMKDNNVDVYSLEANILRTETAVFYALSVFNFHKLA